MADLQKNDEIQCSIIIPNLHSPVVGRTIESIINQQTKCIFEIIVVGMDRYNLVEQYPSVHFIQTPQPVSAPKARNLGIQNALGTRLFFIDSDCVALPGWIEHLQADFDAGWKVIGGSVQTPGENFWQDVYNLAMFHEQLLSQPRKEHRYLATLNLAVVREVIEKVGTLNENLLHGEDIEWTSRMKLAGFSLLFDPNVAIQHFPQRYDLKAILNNSYRSGYYMIEVRKRYPEIFHMPKLLRHPYAWRIFKPKIAIWTTLKIFWRTKEVRRYPRILPLIFKIKAAWCEGAAESLKDQKNLVCDKNAEN